MINAWIIAETAGIVDVVLGFFAKGGLFMWPLLACSIVSVTIMILRGLALRRKL
jgi:biopolymer transport protein ExbB/TolQ